MSKRKLAQIQSSPNYNIPAIFPQNLQNKINFIPDNNTQNNEIYNDITQAANSLTSDKSNMADFIFNQLGQSQQFPRLNLHNKKPQGNGSQGFYEMRPGSRELTLFRPYNKKTNILNTLMHEGTHFLDDERMRTYQQPAMNFLNDHLGNVRTDQDKGNWYTHAQSILPLSGKAFKKLYPFKELKATSGNNSFISHYEQQYLDNPGHQQPTTTPTYSDLNNSLNLPRKDAQIYSPLSEFPSFIVEDLSEKWPIKWVQNGNDKIIQGPNQSNLGRKFLKKMAKATYSGFRDIYNQQPNQNQSFMQAYPAMHKSFVDRLSDLRNVNKYPTQADYTTRLQSRGTI